MKAVQKILLSFHLPKSLKSLGISWGWKHHMSGKDHIDQGQHLRAGAGTNVVTKAGVPKGEGDMTRSRRSGHPHLRILPSGRQEIRAGKNLVLTCRAQVCMRRNK